MRQLLRYGAVGLMNNGAMYGVYLFITYMGVEPKLAMTCVYLLGTSVGFFTHRKFTFAHNGNLPAAAMRFLLAHFFGYFLNLILLLVFVDRLEFPHQWVQGCAIFVVAGFLFLVFKFLVFNDE